MKRWLGSLLFASVVLVTTAAQATNAITTTTLNVRSGPGVRYKPQTVLPAGYPVMAGSCTRYWCQVGFNGYNGWVSLRYLAFKKGGAHDSNPALVPYRPVHHYRGRTYLARRHHPQVMPVHPSGHMGHGSYRGRAPRWWNDYHTNNPNYRPDWRPSWWHRR